jgi:hypothetical protein
MIKLNTINSKKITASGTIDPYSYSEQMMPKLHEKYVVCSRGNIMSDDTDNMFLKNDEKTIEDGVSGNSDHTIRRFHGWRGTTNNISINAHGLRECVSIKTRKLKNGNIRFWIQFSEDLTSNFE